MNRVKTLFGFTPDLVNLVDREVYQELKHISDAPVLFQRMCEVGVIPIDIELEDVYRRINLMERIRDAYHSYRPQLLPLAIIDCSQAPESLSGNLSRDWKPLLGERVREHAIGETHTSMMDEPYVSKLAAAISGALARES